MLVDIKRSCWERSARCLCASKLKQKLWRLFGGSLENTLQVDSCQKALSCSFFIWSTQWVRLSPILWIHPSKPLTVHYPSNYLSIHQSTPLSIHWVNSNVILPLCLLSRLCRRYPARPAGISNECTLQPHTALGAGAGSGTSVRRDPSLHSALWWAQGMWKQIDLKVSLLLSWRDFIFLVSRLNGNWVSLYQYPRPCENSSSGRHEAERQTHKADTKVNEGAEWWGKWCGDEYEKSVEEDLGTLLLGTCSRKEQKVEQQSRGLTETDRQVRSSRGVFLANSVHMSLEAWSGLYHH